MTMALMGGLGIFLLGMILLTDGLKSLAGEALRQILTRAVRGPLSGVGWGALVTALVQSSTATTLTTIGFVSAGLLTFTQSVGVIFGANLGTTSTGWIVSQLGFKVSLGTYAPPLLLLGVFLRLVFKGRPANAGTALVGFGLLFIGIDMLQYAMADFSTRFSPEDLPGAALSCVLLSRLILVAVGFFMTVVMFSSSAAMATTLAAVASGTIGIDQAAALIIGQNLGTTPKAIAASFGGCAAAKRTALAHVLFNLVAGTIAFVFLPWFMALVDWIGSITGADDTPTRLALFHTIFNILGVAILIPIIHPFSRLIERIIPERATNATRFLHHSVKEIVPVALEAAFRATSQVLCDSSSLTIAALRRGRLDNKELALLRQSHEDLNSIRKFVYSLGQSARDESEVARSTSILHAADHTQRLLDSLAEPPRNPARWINDPVISPTIASILKATQSLSDATARETDTPTEPTPTPPLHSLNLAEEELERTSRQLALSRKNEREASLHMTATAQLDPDAAVTRIETMLWLDGITYHLWRATRKLRKSQSPHLETDDPNDTESSEH